MSKHTPYAKCPACLFCFVGLQAGLTCTKCGQCKTTLRETTEARKALDEAITILNESNLTPRQLAEQRRELIEALEQYADKENWGYYDGSGCSKGHGRSEDACFIGPEVARAAIVRARGEEKKP